LSYNSKNYPQPPNSLTTTYTFDPKSKNIKIINQNFDFKDRAKITLNADKSKNRTFFNILEQNSPRKEEKSGIALIQLITNKGKVEYKY
jgi:hypothetical protein